MSDFDLRGYRPDPGHKPSLLFTTTKTDDSYVRTDRKKVTQQMELRKFEYERGVYQPGEPLRKKRVYKAMVYDNGVTHHIGDEAGTANKIIEREQMGTNNKTKIAIDYISDEMANEKSRYSYRPRNEYGEKVVEITRDLKNGDVLEFTARQSNRTGKVTINKLALKSGKAIENIPEFFAMLKGELEPLAKNWLKKALGHAV